MDAEQAMDFLAELFKDTPAADAYFPDALLAATVADIRGNAPGSREWQPTLDEYEAAAQVADRLALAGALTPAQDKLKSFTSEGSTFTFDQAALPNWGDIASQLRARSRYRAGNSWVGTIATGRQHPVRVPRSASRRGRPWLP